ncbi:MAG: hypothetical protein ACK5GK_11235, partial [Akkermansiaceae bacterium]
LNHISALAAGAVTGFVVLETVAFQRAVRICYGCQGCSGELISFVVAEGKYRRGVGVDLPLPAGDVAVFSILVVVF